MDINPRRTLATVGISVVIGGAILYYQYDAYNPGVGKDAKKTSEAIKKLAEKPKPEGAGASSSSMSMPSVAAPGGPKNSPDTNSASSIGGLLVGGTSFGDSALTPKMEAALKRRAATQPTTANPGSNGSARSGGSGGSGGSGSNGDSGTGGGASGGTGGGGASDGATGGTGGGSSDGVQYWIEDASQVRHNPQCDLYKKAPGRIGTKDDGTGCRICGG